MKMNVKYDQNFDIILERYKVEIPTGGSSHDELSTRYIFHKIWLDENVGRGKWNFEGTWGGNKWTNVYFFDNIEDAMAFKLRWL